MSDLKSFQEKVVKFRDDRNWGKNHTPSHQALGIMMEAAELAEHFQWKTKAEMTKYLVKHKIEVADELADVFYWVLLIAYDWNIDLIKAMENKMAKNHLKYPLKK